MCQTLCDEVQEGYVAMYDALRDAAKKVGIKKVGERTRLLIKLNEKEWLSQKYFDEDLKGDTLIQRMLMRSVLLQEAREREKDR